MCNLILNNKTTDDILVNINDKSLILTENEVITFDSMDVKFHITAQVNPVKLNIFSKLFKFLILSLFSLILLVLEESMLEVKIEKYIKLPVQIDLDNIDSSLSIDILTSADKFQSYNISVNDSFVEPNILYDYDYIKHEVHSYYWESFIACLIPIALLLLLTGITIYSKNIIAVLVMIVLILIFFIIWFNLHKKNMQVINYLYSKCKNE